jgi:Lar family restriction alleviation protein
MVDLLSCPFCGLPPVMLATTENDDFVRCYEVRCDHCGIGQSEEYKSQTIELWNTRTSDLAQCSRERAIEECARIVEGNIIHDQYREWPAYSGQGNRSNDSEVVRLCDRLASAIRALADSSTDRPSRIEHLQDERDTLDNSYGQGPFMDGLICQRIAKIDEEIAAVAVSSPVKNKGS